MSLSSQTPRQGMGRQYMSSRRRRRSGWPKWMLLAVVCVGGWYYWSKDKDSILNGSVSPGLTPLSTQSVEPISLATPGVGGAQGGGTQVVDRPVPWIEKRVEPAPEPKLPKWEEPGALPITVVQAQADEAVYEPVLVAEAKLVASEPAVTPQASEPWVRVLSAEVIPQLGSVSGIDLDDLPEALAQGMGLIEEGRLVESRSVLSHLLVGGGELSGSEAQAVRDTVTGINRSLVFSPYMAPGDPLVEMYRIEPGDLLSRVGRRYSIPYQLIELINGVNARRVRVGQRIKVVKGPFHAVVSKRAYRMDIYLGDPQGQMIYVRSFAVGLGTNNSTPMGSWVVKRGGKLINPDWTNPRTNQHYTADNPNNPIGDYWIGLAGMDEQTDGLSGYGIHGTIEPESIGQQASMGCIRLKADDVGLVYKLLSEGRSTVLIQQ